MDFEFDNTENFVRVETAEGIDSTVTTLEVKDASGFPDVGTGFNLVIWNAHDYPRPDQDPETEIVRVTAISGDTLTIERGKEGTTAASHEFGESVMLAPTAKVFQEIQDAINNTLKFYRDGSTTSLLTRNDNEYFIEGASEIIYYAEDYQNPSPNSTDWTSQALSGVDADVDRDMSVVDGDVEISNPNSGAYIYYTDYVAGYDPEPWVADYEPITASVENISANGLGVTWMDSNDSFLERVMYNPEDDAFQIKSGTNQTQGSTVTPTTPIEFTVSRGENQFEVQISDADTYSETLSVARTTEDTTHIGFVYFTSEDGVTATYSPIEWSQEEIINTIGLEKLDNVGGLDVENTWNKRNRFTYSPSGYQDSTIEVADSIGMKSPNSGEYENIISVDSQNSSDILNISTPQNGSAALSLNNDTGVIGTYNAGLDTGDIVCTSVEAYLWNLSQLTSSKASDFGYVAGSGLWRSSMFVGSVQTGIADDPRDLLIDNQHNRTNGDGRVRIKNNSGEVRVNRDGTFQTNGLTIRSRANASSDVSSSGDSYYTIDSSGGARTFTLSSEDAVDGAEISVMRKGANSVAVTSPDGIYGESDDTFEIQVDGASWDFVFNATDGEWEVR